MFNVVKRLCLRRPSGHPGNRRNARQAGGAVVVSMETPWCWSPWWPPRMPSPVRISSPDRRLPGKVLRRRPHPGGFFKREGRPSEKGDADFPPDRPSIRPLFPDGFYNEVQVVATVLLIPRSSPTSRPMIGAPPPWPSPACALQRLIGAARVGYINGQYVLCPRPHPAQDQLDLVVAGTEAPC